MAIEGRMSIKLSIFFFFIVMTFATEKNENVMSFVLDWASKFDNPETLKDFLKDLRKWRPSACTHPTSSKKSFKISDIDEFSFSGSIDSKSFLQGEGILVNNNVKNEPNEYCLRGYCYKSVEKVIGNFTNNHLNGIGEIRYIDGSYFRGQFNQSSVHGIGIEYNPHFSFKFYGNFFMGQKVGPFCFMRYQPLSIICGTFGGSGPTVIGKTVFVLQNEISQAISLTGTVRNNTFENVHQGIIKNWELNSYGFPQFHIEDSTNRTGISFKLGQDFLGDGFKGLMEAAKMEDLLQGDMIHWCRGLRFQIPHGIKTALASFPGSGNTWLRYLLQQATGIYTGAVYEEKSFANDGFLQSKITNGSVIVIKTHETLISQKNVYKKATILVRDPLDSIVSLFNLQKSKSHVGLAESKEFSKPEWKNFLYENAAEWQKFYLSWYKNLKPKNRLIIFYEDLKENTEKELRKILEFLNVPISDETMSCVLNNKMGLYRRVKPKLKINLVDEKSKQFLEKIKKETYSILTDGKSLI